MAFKRQTSGSVVCASCGRLVGVNDETCYHCGRRNPSLWGFAPAIRALGDDFGFAKFAMGACILIYILTLSASPQGAQWGGFLSMGAPDVYANLLFGASGAIPLFGQYSDVLSGRWWTVLSAGWLHGGLLHIFFNLYWLRLLSSVVTKFYGPGRSMILYVGSSALGFLVTSLAGQYLSFLPRALHGASLTVGASAAIFGWIGALVYAGRRSGSSEIAVRFTGFVLPMFVLGFLLPIMDNWAHLGGFAGGWLLGRWLDPAKPDRIQHVVIGFALVLVSLLAVVLSIVHGWTFYRG